MITPSPTSTAASLDGTFNTLSALKSQSCDLPLGKLAGPVTMPRGLKWKETASTKGVVDKELEGELERQKGES